MWIFAKEPGLHATSNFFAYRAKIRRIVTIEIRPKIIFLFLCAHNFRLSCWFRALSLHIHEQNLDVFDLFSAAPVSSPSLSLALLRPPLPRNCAGAFARFATALDSVPLKLLLTSYSASNVYPLSDCNLLVKQYPSGLTERRSNGLCRDHCGRPKQSRGSLIHHPELMSASPCKFLEPISTSSHTEYILSLIQLNPKPSVNHQWSRSCYDGCMAMFVRIALRFSMGTLGLHWRYYGRCRPR